MVIILFPDAIETAPDPIFGTPWPLIVGLPWVPVAGSSW